ncbi:DUF1353 domain-containing protein [Azotobacter vinelandii]|uniref:DUF1353 domain-containing protein n=1 Tax=Azotobacter vinelandii TaxID=354 RepID=UPI000773508F|nr:DUF1353 domain-containing protein [Azotobacter vinelandii]
MPFLSELVLSHVPGGDTWKVSQPLQYRDRLRRLLVVPVGYRTDLASVPRLAWRIVPRDHGQARRPAVVHDYLYTHQTHRFSKAEADRIFYEALREEGMSDLLAWLMYAAVRIGGRGNWSA